MIEKLDFLVRFWELKARHATVGEPLDQREQQELLSLLQLVTADLRIPEACSAARVRGGLPAQLLGAGAALSVELRAVTAAALVVTAVAPMPVGTDGILRATDAVSGVEYTLPCRVAWTYPGSPLTMALVVDGIPTRVSFDGTTRESHPGTDATSLASYKHLFGWQRPAEEPISRRQ